MAGSDTNSAGINQLEISDDTFVSKWDTTLISSGSSQSDQIRLPIESSGTYNFVVDWGDGNTDLITTWDQAEVTHTYSSEGIYTVLIEGELTGWQFINTGDRLKIIEISQWGSINLGKSDSNFRGAENLVLTATDPLNLTGTTTLSWAFAQCEKLGNSGNMNNWDVSSVTEMKFMFYGATSFNMDIGDWDVSSLTDMQQMFLLASSFNQDIGNWNVSSVIDMTNLFNGASSFNQPLRDWDVSNVKYIGAMFSGASSFNQPIGNWDVSSVPDMSEMFWNAISFDQSLGDWDVSSVESMEYMFEGVTLSVNNYDDILEGWSKLNLKDGVVFNAGGSQYTNSSARQFIIDTFNWEISDGGVLGGNSDNGSIDTTPSNPLISLVVLLLMDRCVRRYKSRRYF
ncbi:MAG: BspA family leucine-rich repeat surface protein [Candidatus Kariarchaeaceae archaeon]